MPRFQSTLNSARLTPGPRPCEVASWCHRVNVNQEAIFAMQHCMAAQRSTRGMLELGRLCLLLSFNPFPIPTHKLHRYFQQHKHYQTIRRLVSLPPPALLICRADSCLPLKFHFHKKLPDWLLIPTYLSKILLHGSFCKVMVWNARLW